MIRENLNDVVSGVLFDLMAYLTTRKERLILSSADDACVAVQAIEEFLKHKRIYYEQPATNWEVLCLRTDGESAAWDQPVTEDKVFE